MRVSVSCRASPVDLMTVKAGVSQWLLSSDFKTLNDEIHRAQR